MLQTEMAMFGRRLTAILVVAVIAAAGLSVRGAGEAPPAPPANPAPKADAGAEADAAWQKLVASFQQRLGEADDKPKVAHQILGELADFAAKHPNTDAAATALFNRGGLAMALKEFDTAEQSLKAALAATSNPEMKAQITSLLGALNIRPGAEPPAIAATAISGKKVSLADHKGKVVLIDFWATWCGPCVEEFPNVQGVYKKFHDKGLEILSISLDRQQEPLTAFVKDNGIAWEQVYNGALPEGADIATKYGVNAIPFMIVVGRDGKIAAVNVRGDELEKAVAKALADKAPATQPTTQPGG